MRKEKNNKKDNCLRRLCLMAVVCSLAAIMSGVAVLWYYFAPRTTEASVITVPDLVGVSEDSINLPEGMMLERDYVYSDEADAGTVINQSPAKGSRRKQSVGESVSVKITVSLGKKTGVIPDVEGMPYISAALKLRELGAEVTAVSVYDTDAAMGTVISSEPPKNTQISEGDRVVIYVARGRVNASVRVPDLVGLESSQAIFELMASGLKLGNTEYIIADEALVGRVITQSLCPNIYVKGGTLIDITLGYDPSANNSE